MDTSSSYSGQKRKSGKNPYGDFKRASQYKKKKYSSSLAPTARMPATAVSSHMEVKCIDVIVTNQDLQTGGALTPAWILLNPVQEGTNYCNRVGRKIELVNLQVNLRLLPSKMGTANATGAKQRARLVIIYDRQPNGANPASWGTVFTTIPGNGTATPSVDSAPNLDNRERFIVIRDYRWMLPAYSTDANGAVISPLTDQVNFSFNVNDFSKKVRGLSTMYGSTANPVTIANVTTGAILLATVSDTSAAGAWSIEGETRIRYKDT